MDLPQVWLILWHHVTSKHVLGCIHRCPGMHVACAPQVARVCYGSRVLIFPVFPTVSVLISIFDACHFPSALMSPNFSTGWETFPLNVFSMFHFYSTMVSLIGIHIGSIFLIGVCPSHSLLEAGLISAALVLCQLWIRSIFILFGASLAWLLLLLQLCLLRFKLLHSWHKRFPFWFL